MLIIFLDWIYQVRSLFFIWAIAWVRIRFWTRQLKFSWTALGLPGSVTTMVLFPLVSMTPITLRERQAIGVILSASDCMY